MVMWLNTLAFCFVVSLELKSRGCTAEGQNIFEMEGSG